MADRKSAREKLTGLAAAYGLPVNPEALSTPFPWESSRGWRFSRLCTGM